MQFILIFFCVLVSNKSNAQTFINIQSEIECSVLIFPPFERFPNLHFADTIDLYPGEQVLWPISLGEEPKELLIRINNLGYRIFVEPNDTLEIKVLDSVFDGECSMAFYGKNDTINHFYNCIFTILKDDFYKNLDDVLARSKFYSQSELEEKLLVIFNKIINSIDTGNSSSTLSNQLKSSISLKIIGHIKAKNGQFINVRDDSERNMTYEFDLFQFLYENFLPQNEYIDRSISAPVFYTGHLSYLGHFNNDMEYIMEEGNYPLIDIPQDYYTDSEELEEYMVSNIILTINEIFRTFHCGKYREFNNRYPQSEYIIGSMANRLCLK